MTGNEVGSGDGNAETSSNRSSARNDLTPRWQQLSISSLASVHVASLIKGPNGYILICFKGSKKNICFILYILQMCMPVMSLFQSMSTCIHMHTHKQS